MEKQMRLEQTWSIHYIIEEKLICHKIIFSKEHSMRKIDLSLMLTKAL